MADRFKPLAEPGPGFQRKWVFPVDEDALRYIGSVDKLTASLRKWEATLPWWHSWWWWTVPRIRLVGWTRRLLRLE
jgi:hypothetical protein